MLVGGGLSIEHGNHKTYPNTAREFGFIGLDKVLDCAAAVVSVQRDWGNRSDRKNAKNPLHHRARRLGCVCRRSGKPHGGEVPADTPL